MRLPPPSAMTKPVRVASKGRQARVGVLGFLGHRFDGVERAEGEGGERGLGGAGDHDLRAAFADDAEGFPDGDGAGGATVRVGRAVAADAVGDGDVAVGGAAEDLQRQGGGDGADCLRGRSVRG